jgi:hypothetical protein
MNVWPRGAFLTAEVGWAYQTITNEQGLHAGDLGVHLYMNRRHLSDIERGKREAGIITLQVIEGVSTRRWPICLKDFRFLPADQQPAANPLVPRRQQRDAATKAADARFAYSCTKSLSVGL